MRVAARDPAQGGGVHLPGLPGQERLGLVPVPAIHPAGSRRIVSQITRACPASIAPSANAAAVAGSAAGTAAPDGLVRSSSFSAAVTRQPAHPPKC